MAKQLGQRLVDRRFAVMTGGESVGVNIFVPTEQAANPDQTVSLDFRYCFCRRVRFFKYAVAFVCFPGGFGTMDEFFESMTLIQSAEDRTISGDFARE